MSAPSQKVGLKPEGRTTSAASGKPALPLSAKRAGKPGSSESKMPEETKKALSLQIEAALNTVAEPKAKAASKRKAKPENNEQEPAAKLKKNKADKKSEAHKKSEPSEVKEEAEAAATAENNGKSGRSAKPKGEAKAKVRPSAKAEAKAKVRPSAKPKAKGRATTRKPKARGSTDFVVSIHNNTTSMKHNEAIVSAAVCPVKPFL